MNAEYLELLARMRSIHDKKNADYTNGSNNYENFEQAAVIA